MLLLIALCTFAAVTSFVAYVARPRTRVIQRRILAGASPNELPGRRTVEGDPIDRLLLPALQALGHGLAIALPPSRLRHIQALLHQAARNATVQGFLSLWFLSAAIALGLALLAISALQSVSAPLAFVLAGIIVFYGVATPYVILLLRAGRRARDIERALPDSIDLLVTSIEAGLSVDAAFALVAQRSRPPISDIFAEYLREVGLGRARHDALESASATSGSDALRTLSATVAQSVALGSSLGDVLRIQATTLRAERRLRAREKAARAPILMTIPLGLCFMPAMGVVIVVPTVFTIIDAVGKSLGQ